MRDVRRVVLTGFSGSGKSTVALLLSARLGWHPVDNDIDIEIETGKTIPEIFATDGEAAFRILEREHLERSLQRGEVAEFAGGDEQRAMVGHAVSEATGTKPKKRPKNDVSDRGGRGDTRHGNDWLIAK